VEALVGRDRVLDARQLMTSAVTCLPPTEMVLRSISSARDSISSAPAFARVDL
jgi:hypothetical protein